MSQILEIIKAPNPILSNKTKSIKKFDQHLSGLVEDMIETLHKSEGIGLAANQVGQDLQLAVVEFDSTDDNPNNWAPVPLTVLVNPKIINQSKELVVMEEGCLSVPGIQIPVKRPENIELINHDINGRRYRIKADGLLARICQHEIDHLEGVLITDHKPADTKGQATHVI